MKPDELLKRLRTLADNSPAIATVMIAPINGPDARDLVDELNDKDSDFPMSYEGHITSQDLRDLLHYIDILEDP